MNDGFASRVTYVLSAHREDEPLTDCTGCKAPWGKYRDHLVELIAAERAEADQNRARAPRDFAELLAAHAPYNNPAQGLVIQCPRCVDGCGGGIYRSTADWARHLVVEMARAGFRVTRPR